MKANPSPPRIAALVLDPLALWLAQREHGPGVPLAVTQGGRVRHACALALGEGVQVGMPVAGALSRLPELHTTPLCGPHVQATWAALLAELVAFSPRVEARASGQAFLTLTAAAGSELAAAWQARVGLAETRELALLAAFAAQSGECLGVAAGSEAAFLTPLPLGTLRGVGLSTDLHERLGWLGVRTLGDLRRWNAAQQAAFLGADYAPLKPYLAPGKPQPRAGGVALARPQATVETETEFEEPLCEPGDLHRVCEALAAHLRAELRDRRAARLTVSARVAGVSFKATRDLKEDVRQPLTLHRALQAALNDTGAAPFGIEALHVTLSGLERPSVQPDLWGQSQAREAAAQAEQRFPGCMRRVQWLDLHSLASSHRFQWVRLTGEPAPTTALPAPPAPPAPSASLATSSRGVPTLQRVPAGGLR